MSGVRIVGFVSLGGAIVCLTLAFSVDALWIAWAVPCLLAAETFLGFCSTRGDRT